MRLFAMGFIPPGLALLLVLSYPQIGFAQTETQQKPPLVGSLAWKADFAKKRGQSSAEWVSMETHDHTPSLQATVHNSLLLPGVVAAMDIEHSDGFHIYHWYRIKVLEQGREPAQKSKAFNPVVPPILCGGSCRRTNPPGAGRDCRDRWSDHYRPRARDSSAHGWAGVSLLP